MSAIAVSGEAGIVRSLLVVAGISLILLALATHLWQLDLAALFGWMEAAFGPVFLVLYLGLVTTAGCAALNLEQDHGDVWLELGHQSASGIATLALTFTLLGISLGIESLSRQDLSPETVQPVIRELTGHFSTAFLTTIIGLPTANLLRAILAVRWAAINKTAPEG